MLRAKNSVIETVTKVQENTEDIYAEAKQINIEREENEKPIELVLEPDEEVKAAEDAVKMTEETVKAANEDEI